MGRMAPPSIEQLLGHAPFLERLSRSLVADEHEARDLLQDTWLSALAHPPRHARNLRAWLGVVLRRAAGHRRAARELALGADPIDADPIDTSAERRAVHAAVARAVDALEEPYREVVVLRVFDGLPPRDIAARQGVPVATVHSRLQRALQQLRGRLDREVGRPAWLALLTHRRPGRVGLARHAGGLAVLAVVVVVPFVLFGERAPREASRSLASDAAPIPANEVATASEQASREPMSGAALEAQPASPVSIPRLEISIVDPTGAPVPGAHLLATVYAGASPRLAVVGNADRQGAFELEVVHERLAPPDDPVLAGRIGLQAAGARWTPSEVMYVLPEKGSVVLELGPPGVVLRGLVQDGNGEPVPGATIDVGTNGQIEARGDVLVTSVRRVGRSSASGAFEIDRIPPGVLPVHVSAPGFVDARALWSGDEPEPLRIVLSRGGALVGVVHDELGAPLAGAEVGAAWGRTPRPPLVVRADANGAYALAGLPGGEQLVFARDPQRKERVAFERFTVHEGQALEWNPELEPGPGLGLQLVSEDGEPLGLWAVDLSVRGGLWNLSAFTDARGALRVFEVPNEPMVARVLGPRLGLEPGSLPRRTLDGLTPHEDAVRVEVCTEAPSARVLGQLLDSDGRPFGDGWIVLRPQGSPDQGVNRIEAGTGLFESTAVLPGRYTAHAFLPPLGAVELGSFALEAGEARDLGAMRTEPPGSLALVWSVRPGDRVQLSHVVHGGPVIVHVLHDAPAAPLRLLPGLVEVDLQREGVERARAIHIGPGASASLDLDGD